MSRVVKDLIKTFLIKRGYWIIYSPPGEMTGFNLLADVKKLVNREDPICFDVGANRGQTIAALQETFAHPKIYAFEPSSESFQALKALNLGSDVVLHCLGLGPHNEQQEFINYEDSCLSSFLPFAQNDENQFRNVGVKAKEVVEVKTVDWIVQQHQLDRIDLLKIDTQGYDFQVLQGATESLSRGLIQNILIELNFIQLYDNQAKVQQITDFLANYGIYLVDYYEKIHQNRRLAWCTGVFAKK